MKKIITLVTLIFFTSIFAADRSIQVTGEWKAKIKDDRGSILLTVYTLDNNAKKATATTDRIYNTLLQEIKRLKLKKMKMETNNYHLGEKYRWEKGKRIFEGHQASIGLRVITSEISRIGEVIQKAQKVGITKIGSLQTFVDEDTKREIYRKGLASATIDAKTKADRMLGTLKEKRGKVLRMIEGTPSFSSIPSPRPMYAMEKSVRSAPAPAEIKGGESDISVNVTVTFEIK